MKKWTKLTALLLSLALALTVTGCSEQDVSWAAKLGDQTLPGGVYAAYLMMGYNEAQNSFTGTTDNLLREKIDGQPVVDYIVNYAKTESNKALALRDKFHELGLTVDEVERADALDYAAYVYSTGSEYYRVNKVQQSDMEFIYESSLLSLAVFNSIYGEGGEKEVPREELMDAFIADYTRSQYLVFLKVDGTTGEPLDEAALAEVKAEAESYYQRALVEGQSFTDLIHEMEMSNLAEGAEPYDKFEDHQYDAFLQNLAGYFPVAYEDAVIAAEEDTIFMLEDDNYHYVIKKLPVAETHEEDLDYYLSRLLQNMRYDEFNDMMNEWGDRTDIVYNNATLKEFTPKKLKMTSEQITAALLDEEKAGQSSGSSSAEDSGDGEEESSGNG